MGMRHVSMPNSRNRREFFFTLSRSISSPARNMMYSSPTLPNSSKESSRSRMFSPCSPMAMPASTMPMMWGMRSLPITIGANRIISSTTKKMSVGLSMGKYEERFSMSNRGSSKNSDGKVKNIS